MTKMLWGGRFKKGPSKETIEFNSSENISLDERLVTYDILGNLAHVRMLQKQGILSTGEAKALLAGLKELQRQHASGKFKLKTELEDVHMNVETAITLQTPFGKKMHTARSRNDQVLLDMRLYLRDQTIMLAEHLVALQKCFAGLVKKDGPMVAYTHTRVAQPITVSFWCAGWSQSFARDIERLKDAYKRVNCNPLGAGAIAGTSWKIDREYTAELLGFDSVQENELDTISSRGECEAELLFVCSEVMCKLSRLSEELIWLSQKGLVEIAEEHTTGSSMMPNKKNPDVLELVRGRTGRVYGNLNHVLVMVKGLISGYHSDMQESKFAVMSGLETTLQSINAMAMVVGGVGFNPSAIECELDTGFAQATEIADWLAMNGLPFRQAHECSGNLVKYCEEHGSTLTKLSEKDAEAILNVKLNGQWKAIAGLTRDRLKRKVLVSEGMDTEKKKIELAYKKL